MDLFPRVAEAETRVLASLKNGRTKVSVTLFRGQDYTMSLTEEKVLEKWYVVYS